MVYNAFRKIPHFLQSTCLLCQCRIRHPKSDSSSYFGVCHYCQADLPLIETCCQRCSIPLPVDLDLCGVCLSSSPAYDKTLCAVTYEYHIPELIHRFKTRHDNAVGRLFSELMLSRTQHETANIDCIIATPMHWQRNLLRGNNHSYLLAKKVGQELGIPLQRHLLQRHHPTPVQKTLSAKQRKKNLKNAFYSSAAVSGLRIAIIDDVMTTGSTMHEMAKTLKLEGAREVHCWAVARTPKY